MVMIIRCDIFAGGVKVEVGIGFGKTSELSNIQASYNNVALTVVLMCSIQSDRSPGGWSCFLLILHLINKSLAIFNLLLFKNFVN